MPTLEGLRDIARSIARLGRGEKSVQATAEGARIRMSSVRRVIHDIEGELDGKEAPEGFIVKTGLRTRASS